uniref:MaoC-like dehydratase domain-containing family protein n=1 Tax=Rhizophora mucronata TaxID=61149 RepID=A0A2P2KV11_RHIMU
MILQITKSFSVTKGKMESLNLMVGPYPQEATPEQLLLDN